MLLARSVCRRAFLSASTPQRVFYGSRSCLLGFTSTGSVCWFERAAALGIDLVACPRGARFNVASATLEFVEMHCCGTAARPIGSRGCQHVQIPTRGGDIHAVPGYWYTKFPKDTDHWRRHSRLRRQNAPRGHEKKNNKRLNPLLTQLLPQPPTSRKRVLDRVAALERLHQIRIGGIDERDGTSRGAGARRPPNTV